MSKKWHVLFSICLLLVLCTLPINAEAAGDKAKVTKTVNNFYKAAKSYNMKKMKSYFSKKSDCEVFSDWKKLEQFCRKQNKTLKYKIQSVNIKGNNATVKVKCAYKNAYKAYYNSFNDTVAYLTTLPNGGEDISDNAFKKKYNQFFKQNLKTTPASKKTKTVTVSLMKKGSSWKIKKKTTAILDSINCGYQTAYNSF